MQSAGRITAPQIAFSPHKKYRKESPDYLIYTLHLHKNPSCRCIKNVPANESRERDTEANKNYPFHLEAHAEAKIYTVVHERIRSRIERIAAINTRPRRDVDIQCRSN